jgi:hypothetical protein
MPRPESSRFKPCSICLVLHQTKSPSFQCQTKGDATLYRSESSIAGFSLQGLPRVRTVAEPRALSADRLIGSRDFLDIPDSRLGLLVNILTLILKRISNHEKHEVHAKTRQVIYSVLNNSRCVFARAAAPHRVQASLAAPQSCARRPSYTSGGADLLVLVPFSSFKALRPSSTMAVEIAGVHVAIATVGTLASMCYSAVQGITKLHQSYKSMPLTLASIVLTCNTTSASLNQVDLTLAESLGAPGDLRQELVGRFDAIKLGCSIVLSLLHTHVSDLLDLGNSEVLLKAQKTKVTKKLIAMYNESDMTVLFRQLNVYVTLLSAIQNQLQR